MLDFLLLILFTFVSLCPYNAASTKYPYPVSAFFQKNVRIPWKALYKREKQRKKPLQKRQEKGVPRGKILRSTAVCHNKNMQSATSLVPIKISIVIIRLSQPGGKDSEYCLSRSIFCARTAALHSRHDAICLSGMRLPASMSPYLITDQLPFSSSASADIVSTQSPELR